MPRLDLFKSSLMYSGPTLWNSLPIALTETITVSVFKTRLSEHMLSSLGIISIKNGKESYIDAARFHQTVAIYSDASSPSPLPIYH